MESGEREAIGGCATSHFETGMKSRDMGFN